MSSSIATCLDDVAYSLVLSNITACQSSASTPFCWPPNGTRLCVPAPSGIRFYWPPTYYPTSARVLLEWDLSSNIFPSRNNTGNMTQSITRYMWEQSALAIPGAPDNERSLKMYMRSRVGGGEVVNHEGPTVVLVMTADFTSAISRPTGISRPSNHSEDDDVDALSGMTSSQMAGVIIGVLIAVGGIVIACCCSGCCACCGVKSRAKRPVRTKMDEEEQARIVAQGMELMEQKGGSGGTNLTTLDPGRREISDEIGIARTTRGDGDEIRRVDLDAGRDMADPPPKYTP
ncbi:hypothetical protein DE146DRAFT_128959 [Phaeosphaeria sp. MPI-PUGE-AT-0046c]|nr:hypothetical protein DE146DRAFT_128959 [Phaeosphaeria sp. MPI-PUGE-AT-0046c]